MSFGKGGVDTGGMEAQAAQLAKLGKESLQFSKDVWGQGKEYLGAYALPVLNEYLNILGLGGGYGGAGYGYRSTGAPPTATYGPITNSPGYTWGASSGGTMTPTTSKWGTVPQSYFQYGVVPTAGGELTYVDPTGHYNPSMFTGGEQTPQFAGMYQGSPLYNIGGRLVYPTSGDYHTLQNYFNNKLPSLEERAKIGSRGGGGGPGGGFTLPKFNPNPYNYGFQGTYAPFMGDYGAVDWYSGYTGSKTAPGTTTPGTMPGGEAYEGNIGAPGYASPLLSKIYQYPQWAMGQQYDAAEKQIRNMGLPPGTTTRLLTNLMNQKMQGLGSMAFQQVGGMLDTLVKTGTSLYGGSIAGSGQFMSGATDAASAAGKMYSNIAALQAEAAKGSGLLGGLMGLTSFIPGIGQGISLIGNMFGAGAGSSFMFGGAGTPFFSGGTLGL